MKNREAVYSGESENFVFRDHRNDLDAKIKDLEARLKVATETMDLIKKNYILPNGVLKRLDKCLAQIRNDQGEKE